MTTMLEFSDMPGYPAYEMTKGGIIRNKKSKSIIKKTGSIWVSWPKRTSGLPTDINENIIRSVGLRVGLVDIKVCAINGAWSGLKFVYRLKDR